MLEPPLAEESVRKFVRQAMMHELEVVRTDRRLSAKEDNLRQEITWQSSIRELALRLSEVMFR